LVSGLCAGSSSNASGAGSFVIGWHVPDFGEGIASLPAWNQRTRRAGLTSQIAPASARKFSSICIAAAAAAPSSKPTREVPPLDKVELTLVADVDYSELTRMAATPMVQSGARIRPHRREAMKADLVRRTKWLTKGLKRANATGRRKAPR
jgi:hypothetical protein